MQGVDAVIVENFCDHPAGTKLEPEQMAALTAVATVVAREATIPVGIDAAFCDPMGESGHRRGCRRDVHPRAGVR